MKKTIKTKYKEIIKNIIEILKNKLKSCLGISQDPLSIEIYNIILSGIDDIKMTDNIIDFLDLKRAILRKKQEKYNNYFKIIKLYIKIRVFYNIGIWIGKYKNCNIIDKIDLNSITIKSELSVYGYGIIVLLNDYNKLNGYNVDININSDYIKGFKNMIEKLKNNNIYNSLKR